MKFGIIEFPGSTGKGRFTNLLKNHFQKEVVHIWHTKTALPDFSATDCLILTGGAAFGDYLRPGVYASRSPIMSAVKAFAQQGGTILGVGNGFQILCESNLLPGTVEKNQACRFIADRVNVKTISRLSAITATLLNESVLNLPITCCYGRYIPESEASLKAMNENGQILFRFLPESNTFADINAMIGSTQQIAGICNQGGNVIGTMLHPELAVSKITGAGSGKLIFDSLLTSLSHPIS